MEQVEEPRQDDDGAEQEHDAEVTRARGGLRFSSARRGESEIVLAQSARIAELEADNVKLSNLLDAKEQ